MTREQLIKQLQDLRCWGDRYLREETHQEGLGKSYRTRAEAPSHEKLNMWLYVGVLPLFLLAVFGYFYVAVGVLLIAGVFRLGIAAWDRVITRPGTKRYQAVHEYNAGIDAMIDDSKVRQNIQMQHMARINSDGIYPVKHFDSELLGRMIVAIRDHRADSVHDALNLIRREDEQARRDDETRRHRNAVLDGQRRARQAADANALAVSWAVSRRNRRY